MHWGCFLPRGTSVFDVLSGGDLPPRRTQGGLNVKGLHQAFAIKEVPSHSAVSHASGAAMLSPLPEGLARSLCITHPAGLAHQSPALARSLGYPVRQAAIFSTLPAPTSQGL